MSVVNTHAAGIDIGVLRRVENCPSLRIEN
jgi:hypothetical protein